MTKFILFLILFLSLTTFAGSKDLQGTSAVELQMACNRLHSAKNLRDEWQLDFSQASEKWMEVKKIETAFEPLSDCQERTNSLHQSLVKTDSLMEKEEGEAQTELNSFTLEGEKCKSKEKADRLRLVLARMDSRIKEFKASAEEASQLHKKQFALSEGLEGVRNMPSEMDPKVVIMKERLSNALRAKQALEKELKEVQALERKFEGERNALIEKYKGTKVALPAPQVCDKVAALEWLKETERLTAQMQEMIDRTVALKPKFLNTLKCKTIVDDELLEKTAAYPKRLIANVESRRGQFVIDRCLATATFYDEVAKTLEMNEEADKNVRRMREKEKDDLRRSSAVPTLRRQNEEKRSLSSVSSSEEGIR